MSGKEERKWWRESKELAWGAEIGQASPSPQAETRRAETRRDDTQDSTSRKIMLFSLLHQVHTSLLSAEAIMFQCLHLPAPCFNPGPPPDIYGSLTFDTPLHLRAITCCGWLLSISCDAYSPVCLLYRLVVSLFFFFFFYFLLLLLLSSSSFTFFFFTNTHLQCSYTTRQHHII